MNKMVIKHAEVAKVDMGKGVVRQDLQFGYVIKGGFRLTIGEEVYELSEGDAYLVPADVPHGFVAVGETEAIDVFAPVKTVFPWQ